MSAPEGTKRNLETPKAGAVTELFPYELPFSAAKAIGWLLILLFAAAIAGAVLVEIPETIRCGFVLTPEGGADPVHSPFQGAIETVSARQAKVVSAGEILFTIRSKEIRAWRTELAGLREDLRATRVRKELRERDQVNRVAMLDAELAQNTDHATYQTTYLEAHRDLMARMRALGEQGLASPVDLLSHELALAGAERDLSLAKQAVEATKLKRRQLEVDYEMEVAELDLKASKAEVLSASLERQLHDCEGDTVLVRAPYDGVILSVSPKRIGDVVALGQELCQIARLDAIPLARLSLTEAGLPRVEAGLRVKLYFDAFPYQRFGTAGGTLQWISPAAVQSELGDEFPALVRLDKNTMRVQDEAQPLRIGMRGEARITIGKRTPIGYVVEPLRQLRENMATDESTGEVK